MTDSKCEIPDSKSDKPTGLVTFLFTDIEGSTRLSQEYPETLAAALNKHHSIMREAVESNNGLVFNIVGDAFCCAFQNAKDAVKAAVTAQQNLAAEKWSDAVIKVRIGIHSGTAEWNGNNYMGYITLARVARVMSCAYGEQIIVSKDAYDLLIAVTNQNEITFRDLGERRLKDVIQPIRLFQVLSQGLREDFPPLKTLDARPNNLPVQLTSFIGREEEMKKIKSLLKQTHLLTLTGPGGAGKTRLSLQIAADIIDDFANGVWFVDLAPLIEPSLLPNAVIKALGVMEQPKESPEDTLTGYLMDKEILIILDNCEHVVEHAARLTAKLLNASPKLKIIATSREALRCTGEQTHMILSLESPDPKDKETPEQLTQYESVRLFIERALKANSGFRVNNDNAPALAEICSQLDGIPLAIELAAARTKLLSLGQIHDRLHDRFSLLTGGKRTLLPRQQTLRALIDWSYDLLSEKEKILWSRISVFSGGWTLEAAEEICSDEKIDNSEILDMLDLLTEKSIIVFDTDKVRFSMLVSTRHYGEEKLKESGEYEKFSDKHLKYYIELAEIAEAKLEGSEIVQWLKVLDDESANIEKGLEWSMQNSDSEAGFRLAGAMGYYWNIRARHSEALSWFEKVLAGKDKAAQSSNYYKVISSIGSSLQNKGDYQKSMELESECLDYYRETGDEKDIAKSLFRLGNLNFRMGKYTEANELSGESLNISRKIGYKMGLGSSLSTLGLVAFHQGEFVKATEFYQESLNIYREIGNKPGISSALGNLGIVAFNQGEYLKATEFYQESLNISHEIGNKQGIALNLGNLGIAAYEQGEYVKATELFQRGLNIKRETGSKVGIAYSLGYLGTVAQDQGEHAKTIELFEEKLKISRQIGSNSLIADSMNKLGSSFCEQGEYAKAMEYLQESLNINREIGNKDGIAECLIFLGNLAHAQGEYARAAELYEESLKIYREIGMKYGFPMPLIQLGSLALEQGEYARASEFYEESLEISNEIKNEKYISSSLFGLGIIAFLENKFETADGYYKKSLALSSEFGKSKKILMKLLRLIELHIRMESDVQYSKLIGFIMISIESEKFFLHKSEQILFDEVVFKVKEKTGEEEYLKGLEEGKALTPEKAIKIAIDNQE